MRNVCHELVDVKGPERHVAFASQGKIRIALRKPLLKSPVNAFPLSQLFSKITMAPASFATRLVRSSLLLSAKITRLTRRCV